MNGLGPGGVVSFLLSLVFIIVLAIALIRLLGRNIAGFSGNSALRVVSVLPLGANKTLQVIVLDGKKVLVVGVGAHIEAVAQYDDEELAGRLLQGSAQGFAQSKRLWGQWQNGLRRFAGNKKRASGRSSGSGLHDRDEDYLLAINDRMQSLKARRQEAIRDLDEEAPQSEEVRAFQELLREASRRSE